LIRGSNFPNRHLGPHLWCITKARIGVSSKAGERNVDLSDEVDVGPVMIPGDFSFPATTGDYFEGVVHAQARYAVDHLTGKLKGTIL
jgi:hypothetical protein